MHHACIIHDACTIACFEVFYACIMHVSSMMHARYMHMSTIPYMEHMMHGSPMHDTCMVLSSMNGTCMYVTPHTVNNNFGSKNSKQLQDRVVSKIQLRFIFKFSVNSAWRSVDQWLCGYNYSLV